MFLGPWWAFSEEALLLPWVLWGQAPPPPALHPAHLTPLSAATRESAFVHAIASAGVAFAVTRSCAEGSAAICGCSSRHQGSPGHGWKWGGCSEDIEFGGMVSREFADARENRPDARSAMNRHNNEAGRQVSPPPCVLAVHRGPSDHCPGRPRGLGSVFDHCPVHWGGVSGHGPLCPGDVPGDPQSTPLVP